MANASKNPTSETGGGGKKENQDETYTEKLLFAERKSLHNLKKTWHSDSPYLQFAIQGAVLKNSNRKHHSTEPFSLR